MGESTAPLPLAGAIRQTIQVMMKLPQTISMSVILSVPGKCHCRSLSGGIRAYPELFALVGSRVPELRGRNVSYSGTTTPGQVTADNKGWFRVMWSTWGTSNDDDFAYVFDLSTPIGGGTLSHQGNNVYKYHAHKSGESGHDVTVLWFPVGGTGAETMEVRYLMRALP